MNDTTVPLARIGDNSFAAYAGDVSALESKLANLLHFYGPVNSFDEATLRDIGATAADHIAPIVRDLGKEAHDYLAALDKDERELRAPFETQINMVKAGFRPLVHRTSTLKEQCRSILTGFLQAQERKAQIAAAAALQAQQEADALAVAAAEKAQESGHTFDQMDAVDASYAAEAQTIETDYAQRVAGSKASVGSMSGIAKAASLRITWSAKVVDGPKLVRHYAKRQELIEAALKLAAAEMRTSKGQAIIPGAEAVKTEKAV